MNSNPTAVDTEFTRNFNDKPSPLPAAHAGIAPDSEESWFEYIRPDCPTPGPWAVRSRCKPTGWGITLPIPEFHSTATVSPTFAALAGCAA